MPTRKATPNVYYRKGFKYQLTRDLVLQSSVYPREDIITDFYEIHKDGILIAKRGYATDGPSGPTFDSTCSIRAAVGHDVVYQAMREELLLWRFKKYIDEDFYDWLIDDGMWVFRADRWLSAVRKYGGKESENPYREYSAPNKDAVNINSAGGA
jgi:hypothetical protein